VRIRPHKARQPAATRLSGGRKASRGHRPALVAPSRAIYLMDDAALFSFPGCELAGRQSLELKRNPGRISASPPCSTFVTHDQI